MFSALLQRLRRSYTRQPEPARYTPLRTAAIPKLQARSGKRPVLLRGPRFDANTPPPPAVREYEEARDRHRTMWMGDGLDGAIAAYKTMTNATNRSLLLNGYKLLLRGLTESRPFPRYDYHALPKAARPYLLGPYLDLSVGGAFPQLCWDTSDVHAGRLVYICTGGPVDANAWRQRLPDISAWLGHAWTIGDITANTLTLVRRAPLPAAIPFQQHQLQPGALLLGIDTDTHQTALLPYADMTSGTFIPGASGTGKSNALHIIVQSLLAHLDLFEAVYLIDGKDGVAFNRYRNAAPGKVEVLWNDADVWQLMASLNDRMRQRNQEQRDQGIDNATRDFIAVVIDEMATFTARPSIDPKHPDNKLHARFLDDLTMLARRGRSVGIRLILSAQEPVAEQIPASIRANCLTTIAFRLPVDAHATAVFGQLDGLPADPRKLLRGRALYKNGLSGEVRHVQFPVQGLA